MSVQRRTPSTSADSAPGTGVWGDLTRYPTQEVTMSKTGRMRRGRKKKAANHGKRPNA